MKIRQRFVSVGRPDGSKHERAKMSHVKRFQRLTQDYQTPWERRPYGEMSEADCSPRQTQPNLCFKWLPLAHKSGLWNRHSPGPGKLKHLRAPKRNSKNEKSGQGSRWIAYVVDRFAKPQSIPVPTSSVEVNHSEPRTLQLGSAFRKATSSVGEIQNPSNLSSLSFGNFCTISKNSSLGQWP